MCHIKQVIPRQDYHLEVQLDNGSSLILNLKNRLGTVRFGVISDTELFQRVTTDGSYIRFDNKVEISISELFQLAQDCGTKKQNGRKNI